LSTEKSMATNSHPNWSIGLNAWIIQDGNYPDFEVGQIAEFALEFYLPDGVAGTPSSAKVSASNLDGCLYDTVAEVRVQTADTTILDIGILVYSQFRSELVAYPQGTRLTVRLSLGVDPFHCFEFINKLTGVLPLVYSWKILSIMRQTAPFIETAPGSRHLIRDPQRLGYKEILKTDAWSDDGGHGEYLLVCELLPIPAKGTSATAIP
jgi:hypothetical protein